MSVVLLLAALTFAGMVVVNFRAAVLVYLGLFQVVPITLSLDLGGSLPLVTLTRLLLLPLLAGFAARILSGRLRLDGVPLWLPLALFGYALFAANLLSEARNPAGTLRLASFVMEEWAVLVIAAAVLRTRRDAEAALAALLLGVVASLVFAGYELAAGENPVLAMAQGGREGLIYDYSLERRFGMRRIQSFFRNPLDYGIYLALLLPVAAAWSQDTTGWRRALARAVLVGGTVAVALTLSRTAVYSLAVSAVAYLALRRQWVTLLRGAVTVAVLALTVTLAFGFPLADYLYRSAVTPEQLQGDLGGSSLSSFSAITGEHLAMARQHPIFGRGLATLPPSPAGRLLDSRKVGFGEQGLTYLLVEAGVLGLGAFLLLLATMARRLVHGWRAAPTEFGRRLNLGVLCALVGWMISIELAGVWHFALLLVLVAVAIRAQSEPEYGGIGGAR